MTTAAAHLTQLAHIRHDLRTPVNAIIGYSELLLEDAADTPLAEGLEVLRTLGKTLQEGITHHLDAQQCPTAEALPAVLASACVQLTPLCQQAELQLQPLLMLGLQDYQADLQRIATAVERLQLLLREPQQAAAAPAAAPPSVVTPAPGRVDEDDIAYLLDEDAERRARRGHILVVDDNALNRDMLARGLHKQQRYFSLAANGKQALEQLAERTFDLVLLDILMPEMDGFEVLRRIKADANTQHVPVIMISSLDEISHVVRCIEMGAADYLPKPFDPVLLRARVGACLEQKQLRDKELAYLRSVAQVTEAASAVETGGFQPEMLDTIAARTDALGQLARVFVSMAREVRVREERLQMQVHQLQIEIDESRKTHQVAEITETNYFQMLQEKAQSLRKRSPRQ